MSRLDLFDGLGRDVVQNAIADFGTFEVLAFYGCGPAKLLAELEPNA